MSDASMALRTRSVVGWRARRRSANECPLHETRSDRGRPVGGLRVRALSRSSNPLPSTRAFLCDACGHLRLPARADRGLRVRIGYGCSMRSYVVLASLHLAAIFRPRGDTFVHWSRRRRPALVQGLGPSQLLPSPRAPRCIRPWFASSLPLRRRVLTDFRQLPHTWTLDFEALLRGGFGCRRCRLSLPP